ncbi:uncharacterized protein LOC143197278 isoform X1 [Rhynchophorus ferrugineus]|uniref:uncharacterized protein LOC143197278 isoform X1 n=1 Tax=Rhynchophorus ferrugineus TaxID=354439 RepID=UPI003FCE35A4
MANFYGYSICLLVFHVLLCHRYVRGQTSTSVPQELQPCYRQSYTPVSRPPLTVPVLLELLRKIEINPNCTMNTRRLTTWLMHKVIIDGIVRATDRVVDERVGIPYAATLNKFHKYKVINDYLLDQSTTTISPLEFLSLDEFCFLHKLTSNSIYESEVGSVNCVDNSFSPMPSRSRLSDAVSSCPLKLGNIKTNWGSISVSHLIAGIATGLEPNQVTYQRILDSITSRSDSEKGSPSITTNRTSINHDVDNVLFATIVGDIAEVVLSQVTDQPVIGNRDYLNDTLIPRVFYLKTRQWDMMESEILAGIDGAVLGKTVQHLVNILESTRLSQIIDMYYSDRGIPYQFDFKVGKREKSLKYLIDNLNFTKEIYGATTLLRAIRAVYPVTLADDYVKQLSSAVGETYSTMSASISNSYDQIEYVNTTVQLMGDLEVIIILDDTFSPYENQRLLYTMSDSIHLSYYGSSIGIINGQTGGWITNITREYFEMFRNFENMDRQQSWPTTLSLTRSLETVAAYYQNRTNIDCNSTVIKPIGQAVIIFSREGRLTDNDASRSKLLIQSLKDRYPQTSMIYVSSDRNGFFKEVAVGDQDYLLNPTTDNVLTTVNGIIKKLSGIPAALIKFYCNPEDVRFEKYLTPGIEQTFEINKEYIKRGYVTTKFLNKGYGDLSICSFTSQTSKVNKSCQDVTVNNEISFKSSSLCTTESACDVQYSVTASNSQVICAEDDCRYPDQVLVIITYSYTSSSVNLKAGFFLSLIFFTCFL